MKLGKKYENFDYLLLACITLLFLIGLILIASATHVLETQNFKKLVIQTGSFFVGITVILFSVTFDYHRLKDYWMYLYGLGILLLCTVYIPGLGVIQYGARAWINLKIIYFQPSEIVKILFILSFGAVLDAMKGDIMKSENLLKIFLFPLPFVLFLFKQPDMGGIIVLACIFTGMIFVAGFDIRWMFAGMISAVTAIVVAVKLDLIHGYQKNRIIAFLDPTNPTLQETLQARRSLTAIGSGGLMGSGWMKGIYNQFGFLPVTESDFIFSVLGEEFGFIGMSVVLLLFLVIFFRIFRIAVTSKDFYGTLICFGIFSMFLYQVTQNVGMTIGLLPITGLTLPIVSYGGSSMLSSMIAFSFVMNVALRRSKIQF